MGTHSLTAIYGGNGNYLTSTSSTLSQVVSASISATTTSLISSVNPSLNAQLVTFTATVSPGTATGTLTFKESERTIGTATLSHGSGSLAIANLTIGSHSVTAVYGGDSNDAGSTSSVFIQTVNAAADSSSSSPVPSSSASHAPSGGGGGGGGTVDGTPTVTCTGVGAKRVCTSVLPASVSSSLVFLFLILCKSALTFSDVPAGSWYAPAVFRSSLCTSSAATWTHRAGRSACSSPRTPSRRRGGQDAARDHPPSARLRAAAEPLGTEHVGGTRHRHRRAARPHDSSVRNSMCTPQPYRGAVIESMVELAGLSAAPAANRFSDLPASHPYARAILVAVQLGLIKGDDGKTTVRPDAPISRAEVAVLLTRLENLDRAAFASVPSSAPVSASTPSSAAPALRFTTVSVHLREKTSGHAASLAQLPAGTPVTLLDVLIDWAKVKTADGTIGYVLRKYLRK